MQLCNTCGTRGPTGFLSCWIYWPIFPPLDCVSYQWLDICYIWIIAGRGSNVILMTDIHQSINVGCQSHAGSGIKKSEPGKHISISLPSRVSLDPGSAPGMTNGRFFWGFDSLFGWPTLRDERWMSGRETWDDQRWNPITISRSVSNHQHSQPPKLDP